MNKEQEATVMKFVEAVSTKMDKEIAMMRQHEFVFDDLDNRWQKLAFTLYTDIAQMSTEAEQILEYLGEQ